MEMNRYLIAALYVMAGCAVTIPLKAQGCSEPLRGERCRLVITNTVKVVSIYLEENDEQQAFCGLLSDYFHFPKLSFTKIDFPFNKNIAGMPGPLCRTSHQIRAPEK
ncbi:MAG: hypothetical protein RR397_06045 [Odoribacter sp.]